MWRTPKRCCQIDPVVVYDRSVSIIPPDPRSLPYHNASFVLGLEMMTMTLLSVTMS